MTVVEAGTVAAYMRHSASMTVVEAGTVAEMGNEHITILLTHFSPDKMVAISQMTFSYVFS